MRKIAVDLGNGNTKAAEVRNGEIITVSLPSQVGVGDTSLGALDLGGMERKRRERKPVALQFDGGDYLVGHNLARYAVPLERFDSTKYSDAPEVRALVYATLAELLDGGPRDVAIIAALPVEIMMSEAAKDVIKGVESWLMGAHRFICDGRETTVNVLAVRVMAQPAGAFFAWGMDKSGHWARGEADLTQATVAVLDSGFNTLDLLMIRQGRIEKRFTGGETLGVRRAAEEIARAIKARWGYGLSRGEIDEYIRQAIRRGGKPALIVNGQVHDLKPVIKQALNGLATRTVGFVEETWGNTPLSYVLLAGGGALVLEKPITRLLPQAQMLPDPVTVNAAGLAKLAQRPGVFKDL